MAHELFLFAHEFHEFTRITKRLDNGDLRSHEFSLIKALYLRFSAALGNMSTLYFLTFSAALACTKISLFTKNVLYCNDLG